LSTILASREKFCAHRLLTHSFLWKRLQRTEIEIAKPKNNLPYNELKAIKELKDNPEVNIKEADKVSTTVIMNKQDKIECQIQLNDEENYRPLATLMVEETSAGVERLTRELHQNHHIDAMTTLSAPNSYIFFAKKIFMLW